MVTAARGPLVDVIKSSPLSSVCPIGRKISLEEAAAAQVSVAGISSPGSSPDGSRTFV